MPTKKNKSYGWIKREGKLGGPGYTKKTTATRHRILKGVVAEYGYRSALGSIVALERATRISKAVRKVLESDRVWLRETFGAASRTRATVKKKPATKKTVAKKRTTPRRVPSVARRIRKVKAAMGRYDLSTPAGIRAYNAATKRSVDDARKAFHARFPGYAAWRRRQPKQRTGYSATGQYIDFNTGYEPMVEGDYRDMYARSLGQRAYANPSAKSRKNPSECGLHGIPMHGGSCVACLYEADIL